MEQPMPLPLELILYHVIPGLLPRTQVLLSPSHVTTKTLLAFTRVCAETRRVAIRYLRDHCVYLHSDTRLSSYLLALQGSRPDLRNVCGLFLAPFGDGLDDLPTATWTRELLFYTCSSLRKLVIDLPLRSLYPDDDHLNVRRVLRDGFERLELLEEFCSTRDELYLDTKRFSGEAPVWKAWRRLRKLALYNVDIANGFCWIAAGLPELETIVLTRADGLADTNIKTDLKAGLADGPRSIKVLLVNAEGHHTKPEYMIRWGWDSVDPGKNVSIMLHDIPYPDMNEDPIELCQDAVQSAALDGTLWDWEGELLVEGPMPEAW